MSLRRHNVPKVHSAEVTDLTKLQNRKSPLGVSWVLDIDVPVSVTNLPCAQLGNKYAAKYFASCHSEEDRPLPGWTKVALQRVGQRLCYKSWAGMRPEDTFSNWWVREMLEWVPCNGAHATIYHLLGLAGLLQWQPYSGQSLYVLALGSSIVLPDERPRYRESPFYSIPVLHINECTMELQSVSTRALNPRWMCLIART